METIQELEPKTLWKNFYALTQVPRPSGHLDKIRQFLLDFAKENDFEAFTDSVGNVIYRKPATPGMENRKVATLQAHMDMVPQKAEGATHNFETDPIETYIDGDWVKAKGTTLGSDDGMGVAAIMAVMADKSLVHGPLEALLTVDEETGMEGARLLESNTLKGEILLNLDDETEGEMIIGSAGGVDILASLQYKETEPCAGDTAVKVVLKDLRGGHSGLEIGEGRANANKLMARFVRNAILETEAQLASWHGGNMRNAIPRQAEVVLVLPKENVDDLKILANNYFETFKEEYKGIESGFSFTVEEMEELPAGVIPEEIQDNLVDAIYAARNGVERYIPENPSIVESSSNLAIIDIANGQAEIHILARSSSESVKEYMIESLDSCFSMAGMKVETSHNYKAWQPNFSSPIVAEMKEVYKNLFGKEPLVQVVHAGLECGIIGVKYPKMDMVSFGPTLRSPHTPNERCLIPTVGKYYTFLTETLKNIPENK